MSSNKNRIINIDLENYENKILGRLSTYICGLLSDKDEIDRLPNEAFTTVVIKNVKHLIITGNKKNTKVYYKSTQYVGNVKERLMKDISYKELLYNSVKGMLPKNKSREHKLSRLIIEE